MTLEFRSHYSDDHAAKTALIELTRVIHGLDLRRWDDAGLWDENYVPFSFLANGRIVSNVCAYLLPMRVAGRDVRVAQISNVGTVPEFRRRGLSHELLRRALAWCADRAEPFTFLFADENARGFYERRGYRALPQHRYVLRVKSPRAPGTARVIDPTNQLRDRELLLEIARHRVPASNELGVGFTLLLSFYALYTLSDCGFHLGHLDTIAFARKRGETLHLFDVVAPRMPPLEAVLQGLPIGGYDRVEFGFMPDAIAVGALETVVDPEVVHLGGDSFPLRERAFRFPYTAKA